MNYISIIKGIHKIPILLTLMISIILMAGSPIFAAPSITGVYGTVANGQTIQISGAGFGSGPTVVLFDDFEKGSNGSLIRTGVGSAQIGKWDAIADENATRYSNANKVSGSLAFRSDQSAGYGLSIETAFPASTTKVFISWWLLIPSGTVLPGTGNSNGINWKNLWVLGSNTVDDDLVMPTFLGLGDYFINGNDAPYGKWINLDFNIGTWKRLSFYLNGGSNGTGQVHFWDLTSSGMVQRVNDNNVTVLNSGGAFERISLNAYGRQTNNCYPTFDDIYVAIGDNCRARVEIGNNATYSNCTKLAMATPDSWNNTSISAKVWQGNFSSSETAYLFIFDSSGNVSAGYPIQFGLGGTVVGDAIAPTVQITSPSQNTTYQTTTSSIVLSGTASDNVGVTSVSWLNSQGGLGMAAGTSNWSCSSIPLQQGSNIITITATDAAGNSTNDTITVTYTIPDTTPPARPSGVTLQIQ